MSNSSIPRVLVVDDMDIDRTLMTKSLSLKTVHRIDEADCGAQAIRLLTEAALEGDPYVAVFCDWNMPDLSGIDVLKTFRLMEPYKNTAFVMVTAETEPQSLIKAYAAGVTSYVTKPFTTENLTKAMVYLKP